MVLGLAVGVLGFFVVSITRAGACVAGGPASTLPDWPAPDGPAASFPSAGVGAVSLALEGGVDPRCEWGVDPRCELGAAAGCSLVGGPL